MLIKAAVFAHGRPAIKISLKEFQQLQLQTVIAHIFVRLSKLFHPLTVCFFTGLYPNICNFRLQGFVLMWKKNGNIISVGNQILGNVSITEND